MGLTQVLLLSFPFLQENFEKAFEKDPDAVRYQIIGEELYRVVGLNGEKKECKHPARCQGIEYALLQVG